VEVPKTPGEVGAGVEGLGLAGFFRFGQKLINTLTLTIGPERSIGVY
jgi:hypothetical protein